MTEEILDADQRPLLQTRRPPATARRTASMADLLNRTDQAGTSLGADTQAQPAEPAEESGAQHTHQPPTAPAAPSGETPRATDSPTSETATEQAQQNEQNGRPANAEMAGLMNILMRRLDDINRGTNAQFAALNQANQACHNRITELQDGMRAHGHQPNPGPHGEPHRMPNIHQGHHLPHPNPAEAHLQELEALKATIESMNSKMHQAISSAPEIDRVLREAQNTPFTERISRVPVRHNDKIRLPTYAGGADPSQHVTAFSIAMGRAHFLPEEEDAGKCQLFVETLTDDALTWFSRLETHSIDSYQDLSTAFVRHYSIYIKQGASDADLWNISQAEDEPLRSYLDRFKNIVSKVTVSDQAAIQALRHGLKKSAFRADLILNRPQTLEDALHKGTSFADVEDEEEALSQKNTLARSAPLPGTSKDDKDHRKPERRPNMIHVVGNSSADGNISTRKTSYVRQGVRPYCDFHKWYGHSNSECQDLEEYLLTQFQSGEIGGPDDRPNSQTERSAKRAR